MWQVPDQISMYGFVLQRTGANSGFDQLLVLWTPRPLRLHSWLIPPCLVCIHRSAQFGFKVQLPQFTHACSTSAMHHLPVLSTPPTVQLLQSLM